MAHITAARSASLSAIFLAHSDPPLFRRAGPRTSDHMEDPMYVQLLGISLIITPDTKIDWPAYMQQVDMFLAGERDYSKIEGETGPLVQVELSSCHSPPAHSIQAIRPYTSTSTRPSTSFSPRLIESDRPNTSSSAFTCPPSSSSRISTVDQEHLRSCSFRSHRANAHIPSTF